MTTARARKQGFSRHNQPVPCKVCGKLTTEIVGGHIGLEMCGKCIDQSGLENEHADGYHDDAPNAECPDCKIGGAK